MANGCAVTEPSTHWLFHRWPGLGVDSGLLGILNTFWGVCVFRIWQTCWDTQGSGGRRRSHAQPLPHCAFRRWWPASQHFEAGTHPSGLMNPSSCLLQRERGWLSQVILLLDGSSGHLIFYNLEENQLNVLKATCFLSGIFKWCGSYFGCS